VRQRSIPSHALVCLLVCGCTAADERTGDDVTDDEATAQGDSSEAAPNSDTSDEDDTGEPPDDDTFEEDPTSDTGGASEDSSDDATSSSDDDSGGEPVDQLPPTDSAALLPWLEAGSYLAWDRESAIHPSAGPHGGDVRTYVNAALVASLAAGAASHPVDAAVVKELYDAEVVGFAVMVKVAPGTGGDTWYWYEIVGSSTYADGVDESLCWGCHEAGADQVLTPFPLQ
jgi:hypothetical protein